LDLEGSVAEVKIAGGVVASGHNSDAVHVSDDGRALHSVLLSAPHGQRLVRTET
jgi:hypothetical protein